MRRSILSVLVASLGASGCGTVMNVQQAEPKVFGGTQMSVSDFSGGHQFGGIVGGPVCLVDKPFSFAGDVVTLPYVLLSNPARGLVGESVEDAQRIAKERGYLLTLSDDPCFPIAGRIAPRRIEVDVKDGVVAAARTFPGTRW